MILSILKPVILYTYTVFDSSHSCGLEVNQRLIVTGGYYSLRTVAEFTLSGAVTYLPDLQEGRWAHACSKFLDSNGETVSL